MKTTDSLPDRPSLGYLKTRAEELCAAFARGDHAARQRVRKVTSIGHLAGARGVTLPLTRAQFVIAREYGFASWPALKHHIESRRAPDRQEAPMKIMKLNLQTTGGKEISPVNLAPTSDTPLAGLDLGSSAIKAVLLSRSGAGYAAAGLAFRELEEEPGSAMTDTAVHALNELVGACGFPLTRAAVGLSGSDAYIRPVDIQAREETELQRAFPDMIEQYLPVAVAESVMDIRIMDEAVGGTGKVKVMMAAGRADARERLRRVAAAARVECAIVDVDELALTNMYAVNYGADPGFRGTVCLLNVGARTTSLLFFSAGELTFCRSWAWGGDTLTADVRREMSLETWMPAEDMKRKWNTVHATRLEKAVAASLGNLAAEVKRCCDYYDTQFKGRGVERMLLSGGGAKFKNLDRFLAGKLEVMVEMANPFRNITLSAGTPGAGLLAENAPAFGVAVGLALRRFD